MDNKYKKGAFVITLILFIISLPFTVLGIIYHKKNSNEDNNNNQFHYNNKLYFYDTNDKLLGTYECLFDNCGYADETIDDYEYGINYSKLILETSKVIDNKYAIISDYKDTQNSITIYDIKNNKEIGTYAAYKIYNIGLENNYIIVKSITGNYGVIQIDNGDIKSILPFEYDFIGLKNEINNSKIKADAFIVYKDNLWSLVDVDGDITTKISDVIIDYNESSVIAKTQAGNYNLLNYDGTFRLYGEYKKIDYLSNYISVIDQMNNYYVINKDTLMRVSQSYQVNDNSTIDTKINDDGKLEIIIDNESKEIVEI